MTHKGMWLLVSYKLNIKKKLLHLFPQHNILKKKHRIFTET